MYGQFKITVAENTGKHKTSADEHLTKLPQKEHMGGLVAELVNVGDQVHTQALQVATEVRDGLSASCTAHGQLERAVTSVMIMQLKDYEHKVTENMVAEYESLLEPFDEPTLKSKIFEDSAKFTACSNAKNNLGAFMKKVEKSCKTDTRVMEYVQICKKTWQSAHNYVGVVSCLNTLFFKKEMTNLELHIETTKNSIAQKKMVVPKNLLDKLDAMLKTNDDNGEVGADDLLG